MIGTPVLSSVDELNEIIQPLMEYMNSLPRWTLGGRAPKDIPVSKDALSQLAATAATFGHMKNVMNYQGVGRNDPCPCGSGLKYKNCHGNNFS
ncbi:MAG: SEC-C domain-containing protein [Bacteroidales bacterium]|nr:SEC-C domain-containing protein [Candidatus Cacconaster merdequi]